MENMSAPEPDHTFTIFQFLLINGASSVVTIEYYRDSVNKGCTCSVRIWARRQYDRGSTCWDFSLLGRRYWGFSLLLWDHD